MEQSPSHRIENPWHDKADRDGEHTEGEEQVLLDRADCLAGEEEEMRQPGQVVREDADLGGFDCKIGPPRPIATPTSAKARAGPSLTPSPTKATRWPAA